MRARNPNWGRSPVPGSQAIVVPPQFETLCLQYGTHTLQQQKKHPQLREWVRKNWRKRYVPEALLAVMGFDGKEIEGFD